MTQKSTPSHHTKLPHLPPLYTYYNYPPISRAAIITPLSKALMAVSTLLQFLPQLTSSGYNDSTHETHLSPPIRLPSGKTDNTRLKITTKATDIAVEANIYTPLDRIQNKDDEEGAEKVAENHDPNADGKDEEGHVDNVDEEEHNDYKKDDKKGDENQDPYIFSRPIYPPSNRSHLSTIIIRLPLSRESSPLSQD